MEEEAGGSGRGGGEGEYECSQCLAKRSCPGLTCRDTKCSGSDKTTRLSRFDCFVTLIVMFDLFIRKQCEEWTNTYKTVKF